MELTSNPFLQEVEAGLILVGPDQPHTEGVAGRFLQDPALIQHVLYLLALQDWCLVHHLQKGMNGKVTGRLCPSAFALRVPSGPFEPADLWAAVN